VYTLKSGAIVTVESTWMRRLVRAADQPRPRYRQRHPRRDRAPLQKSPQLEVQGLDEPWMQRRYVDYTGPARYRGLLPQTARRVPAT